MKYKDASFPVEERVEDLLSRMTVEEKTAQLCCLLPMMIMEGTAASPEKLKALMPHGMGRLTQYANIFLNAPEEAVKFTNQLQRYLIEETRLGIPVMNQIESLNGLLAVKADSYPTAIYLASTWEPELIEEMGAVIARQAKAIGAQQVLAPVVDLARDARWGRVHETFGECPYLNSAMGVAYTRGIQGENIASGVIATAKHFLGYGVTEGGLNVANSRFGEREILDEIGRPFEAMIREADLKSVMTSYSEIDGIPCTANRHVLMDLLRGKFGFDGVAVSDGGAIEQLHTRKLMAKDYQEAGVMALKAGLDSNNPNSFCYSQLGKALDDHQVTLDEIDRAVHLVLEYKFRTGLFEHPYLDEGTTKAAFGRVEDDVLNQEITSKGITLLQNKNNLLPLKQELKKIAVIGPFADNMRILFGGYTFPAMLEMLLGIRKGRKASMEGVAENIEQDVGKKSDKNKNPFQAMDEMFSSTHKESPLSSLQDMSEFVGNAYQTQSFYRAIQDKFPMAQVKYEQGCDFISTDTSGFKNALALAQDSNVTVIVVGEKSGWVDSSVGEGKDRASLKLLGAQEALVKEIAKTGTDIILVLINGRPLELTDLVDDVDAIVEMWLPGPKGSAVLADVLAGDINPGGKLPVSFPKRVGQVPVFYNQKNGSGQASDASLSSFMNTTYVDCDAKPLFPFGYGLSYTSFKLSNLVINQDKVSPFEKVSISCCVKNTGDVSGDEVVQFYFSDRHAWVSRPNKELVGFKRVRLAPGESATIALTVDVSMLAFHDHEMKFVLEPGTIDVTVGTSSEDLPLQAAFEITAKRTEIPRNRKMLSNASISRS